MPGTGIENVLSKGALWFALLIFGLVETGQQATAPVTLGVQGFVVVMPVNPTLELVSESGEL